MAEIDYQVHVQDIGWMPTVKDGQIAGTVGQHKRVEAYNIQNIDVPGLGVHAFAHVQDYGWLEGKILRQDVGTTGEGKRIEAIKIGLIGPEAQNYDIWYRCHVEDIGWMNWSCNGEENGTVGGGKQVEAIQIEVHAKTESYLPVVNTVEKIINLTPQNVPVPQALNLVDVARQYVGYVSGTSNDSVFGRRIVGENAGDWCCYFVVCCAIDAGFNVPITGYVPTMHQWALDNGRFATTPQQNYFVLYDFNGNGTPDHIGIVDTVYGQYDIDAIEGNTGNPVGVYKVARTSGILGYINPF